MPRDRYAKQSLGTLHGTIKQTRALMVGAGGIGCELLKNLVLMGFGEIHIVDLDTIDLSNLNRQFLFRQEHVKKSKALVAKETAGRFNSNVKIEAHHANIKDPEFNLDWFSTFNVVFNALDNLEARRHVNKMCLAADVPLIESGTTGFNGQVQVIKRGRTECYDCNPKEIPKSFPVCTIRSTPSQPIHCIVWAKSYLFAEVFGTSEDDSPELDMTQHSDDAKEIEQLRAEAQALKRIRKSMGSPDFSRLIFQKVFADDIERLRSMEDMWRTRKKPTALDFDALLKEATAVDVDTASRDQQVWSVAENLSVFSQSLRRLSERLEELRKNAGDGDAPPVLSFDKDDKDTLDFVAASANLRSVIFDIATKSEFEIKQMAGNIIPAIATTNAMTAGLCVLQAFKILRGLDPPPPNSHQSFELQDAAADPYSKSRNIFLSKSTDRILDSEPLNPPNPACPVCGVCQARLEIDPERATLDDLVTGILKGELGYGDELSVSSEAGLVYDPDFDDNLPKKLSELGIGKDSFVTVVDEGEDEDPRVNLVLFISEKKDLAEGKPMALTTKFDIARKIRVAQPVAAAEEEVKTNGDHGGLKEVVANGATERIIATGGKRKREAEPEEIDGNVIRKRGTVGEEATAATNGDGGSGNGDGAFVVDDHDDGAILIDD